MQKSLGRRSLRILVKLSIVAVVSLLLLEIALRFLLFSTIAEHWSLARRLRKPENFADPRHDDAYWILQREFLPRDEVEFDENPTYDPVLGWTGSQFTPEGKLMYPSLEHVGPRRPVILLGDSYAQCNTAPIDCFQALVRRSHLGQRYSLINLGVGGYGLDQVYLLLERALDGLKDMNPIIVVGILVEDDMDRAALSIRGFPKPRLELHGGELVPEEQPVPRMRSYLATHPAGIASYVWSRIVHAPGLLPREIRDRITGEADKTRRVQAINRAILSAIVRAIERRHLEYFFLLFYSEGALLDPGGLEWRDDFLVDTLRALRAPWVSSRWALLDHAAFTGRSVSENFGHEGALAGHLTPLGNRVAFEALSAGLAGRFEPGPSGFALAAVDFSDATGEGEGDAVRFEVRPLDSNPRSSPVEQLVMSVGDLVPTRVRYDLHGKATSFRAEVGLIPPPELAGHGGSVRLSIQADGALLYSATFRSGEPLRAVEVDLTDKAVMRLMVDEAADGSARDRLVLAWPWFEP